MNSLTTQQLDCDLCGSSQSTVVFVKEGFNHVRCDCCGLVYVNPRLAGHLDTQKRSGTGSMGDLVLTPKQRERLAREVHSYEPFRKLNRMLDIGAGRGWLLNEAARLGWETWALEINSQALECLEALEAHRIIRRPAEELDAAESSMDVVRMWDVIEHLQSPRKAVGNIHRALRPGGALVLATTNLDSLSFRVNGPEWVYLNGADHIFLFEPATIARLLQEAGFSGIKIRTRSFNLRRKLYHPPQDLPRELSVWSPVRKIVDELIRFTRYGHQMVVTALKS